MESQRLLYWDVYADGASIATEKKSAIGAVLYRPNLQIAEQKGTRLPRYVTSHEAEYQAILAGLELAYKHKVTHLRMHCDCATVVGQLRGSCKINAAHLKEAHAAVVARAAQFAHVEYVPIDRKQNTVAHELANKALFPVLTPKVQANTSKPTATKTRVAVAVQSIKPVRTTALIPRIPLPTEAPQQFWKPVGDELWVWNLPRLWNAVNTSPIEVVNLAELEPFLMATGWFGNEPLTLGRVAELARHVTAADKNTPLLLGAEGDLLDGRFRLAKAVCEGREQIAVKRLKRLPTPDGRFPLRYCP